MTPPELLTQSLADRYAIERELGAGGMATVYVAHDLRHDRDVAIKVLHPDLGAALGGERFLAEVRTTARLQHPHILPLLDSGTAGALLYYVMPYVAGETLRTRLARETQLPVADALRIATDVADALAHAHSQGIIHRDIKPENILLQGGHALVADFGIALAVQQAGGARMTQTGLSLGTPQYMAPEQAMGEKAIDARADVYALGAVTYEMLAGAPPFVGPTVQAIVARILTEKPGALRTVRQNVPVHVEDTVLAALAKLPADRIASAEDFARALAAPSGAGRAPGHVQAVRWPRSALPVAIAAAIGVAAGVGAAYLAWHREDVGAAARPPGTFVVASLATNRVNLSVLVNRIAVTPDGRWIAFVAAAADGETHVFLRAVGDLVQRDISAGGGPKFSPDGRSLAYSDGDNIMIVPVSGGMATRLVSRSMASGSWGADGRIRFVTGQRSPRLYSVEVATGAIDSLAFGADTLLSGGELLPGNRLLLSLEVGGAPRIVVRDADGGTRLLLDGHVALYAPVGHIVFTLRQGEHYLLMRARFDPRSATLIGAPEPLAQDASAASHAVTHTGDLLYLSGATTTDRQIVSLDRGGNERAVTRGTHNWSSLRLGDDGVSIVATIWDGTRRSIWSVNGATGAMVRLTREIEAFSPALSPDGGTVYFNQPNGRRFVWQMPAGGGPPVALSAPRAAYVASVSADGSTLWLRVDVGTTNDLWALALGDSATKAVPVLATAADETNALPSPDGRWLAYLTDASGRAEVVIAPRNAPANATQISTDGVSPLRWSADSRRLFYRQRDEVWEVAVGAAGADRATARRIFTVPSWLSSLGITSDGERMFAVRGGFIYADLIVKQGALQ